MKGQGYKQSYVEFWAVFYFCSDLPNFWHATRLDNVNVPSGFLCSSFVEGETKAFCFYKVFLHTLYLKEKKTSGKKNREMFS